MTGCGGRCCAAAEAFRANMSVVAAAIARLSAYRSAVLVDSVAVNLTATSAPELEILRDIAATRRGFRLGLTIEKDCQPDGGDGPVGDLAQLSDLGPVHIAIEPDADPSAAAYIRRPEEPVGPRGDELLL